MSTLFPSTSRSECKEKEELNRLDLDSHIAEDDEDDDDDNDNLVADFVHSVDSSGILAARTPDTSVSIECPAQAASAQDSLEYFKTPSLTTATTTTKKSRKRELAIDDDSAWAQPCDACRRRRKRCDRALPRCSNCERRNVDCAYKARSDRSKCCVRHIAVPSASLFEFVYARPMSSAGA
jgi:Fungal Zn(2)-Cys(6) binuclear cluster domain